MGRQIYILHTNNLVIGYQQGKRPAKVIAGPLNLDLPAGQLICLLGPNGSGKSTLLRTISGLQEPLDGAVELDREPLKQLNPAAIAKKISLVLTDSIRSASLDVYALVSLGRYPYSGWLGMLNKEDKQAIDYAIQVTGIAAFVNRRVDTLSDGECQKVMLARAIAQDTPLIILDEPTAHLDLPSRIQLMRLLNQLAKETGKAILISTHELDLALQVSDQIWLMSSDGHFVAGLPEELVLNGSFQHAFNKEGIEFDIGTGTFPLHQTSLKTVTVAGDGPLAFWTKKALIRNGFSILADQHLMVTVSGAAGPFLWTLKQDGIVTGYDSLQKLLLTLQLHD